jgi:hypothetical protein
MTKQMSVNKKKSSGKSNIHSIHTSLAEKS